VSPEGDAVAFERETVEIGSQSGLSIHIADEP
jgi:hypothetical protein